MNQNPYGNGHNGGSPSGSGPFHNQRPAGQQPYQQQPQGFQNNPQFAQQNQYGLPPGGKAASINKLALVVLVIGSVILIGFYVLAFFGVLFADNSDSSDSTRTSETSSSDDTMGAQGTDQGQPSQALPGKLGDPTDAMGKNVADNSLPSDLQGNLPVDLNGWLYGCEQLTFTLEEPGAEEGSGEQLDGVNCTGAIDKPWALETVQIIEDADYTNDSVEHAKDSAQQPTVVSDKPDNFAAMTGNEDQQSLTIANPQKGTTLQIEFLEGGREQAGRILSQLGYSVNADGQQAA